MQKRDGTRSGVRGRLLLVQSERVRFDHGHARVHVECESERRAALEHLGPAAGLARATDAFPPGMLTRARGGSLGR